MTTATRTPFTVEKIDLRDPHGADCPEVWELQSAEEAAERFDSEVSPENWPLGEIVAFLEREGEVVLYGFEAGFQVIARRS